MPWDGYNQENWIILDKDFRKLLMQNNAVEGEKTDYGRKYQIHGVITGPNGHTATIITVWIILHGENIPKLITAYPEN